MKTLILTSILGLAAMLTSCQTSAGGPESAVTCDKCRTVYFKAPASTTPGGKGMVTLRDASRMDCPDCESAAANFFKTGSLKHKCSHCEGSLSHCAKH